MDHSQEPDQDRTPPATPTPVIEIGLLRASSNIARDVYREFKPETIFFVVLMALAPVLAWYFHDDKQWVLRASPALLVTCALLVLLAAFAKQLPHERKTP